jgi:hypothetical protein
LTNDVYYFRTDTFTNLKDDEDLIDINKVEVKISGLWPLPHWLLDKVFPYLKYVEI